MKQNSIEAYLNHKNQRAFKSHKGQIVRVLNVNPLLSSYQIAEKTGLTNEQVQKRLSDSNNADIFEVGGYGEHNENTISLYQLRRQLSWVEVPKKRRLRDWLKEKHPEIMHEFETLIEHKL